MWSLLFCTLLLISAVYASVTDVDPGFSATLLADKTVSQAGWTELTGWTVNSTANPGQFTVGAAVSSATGRYTATQSGVYIVTTTTKLKDASGSYFRLLVAMNGDHNVNNGIAGIEGPPPSQSYTMTVTGAIEILAGEYVSIYFYSASDSNWKALAGSSFSVRYLGPKQASPGFMADVSTTLRRYQQTGWVEVQGYRISTTNSGMFNEGTGFSTATGRFTAPCTGSYFVAANVRLRYATSNYFRLLVAVNGVKDINNGLHVIRGSPPSFTYTLNVAGVVKLKKGDYVSVWVNSYGDTNWYLEGESSFSTILLGDLSQMSTGFHADLTKDIPVTTGGSKEVTGWTVSGAGGKFTVTDFDSANGHFLAPADGVYYVSGLIRLDGINSETQVYFAIDGKRSNNASSSTWTSPPSSYYSFALSTIVRLQSGQKLSLFVTTQDNNYSIQSESGLSLHQLSSTSSWAAIHVKLPLQVSLTSANAWKTIGKWTTGGNTFGLLIAGTSFNAATGKFVVAQSGLYYISAVVHIRNDAGAETRLAVAINDVASSQTGLTAVQQNPTGQVYTLSLSGYLVVSTENVVSLQIRSMSSNSITIDSTSDFSLAFVSGPVSVPAFAANLQAAVAFTSTGWKELKSFSSSSGRSAGMFQSQGFNFDYSTGRFTPPQPGLYLAMANVELTNADKSQFKCAVAVNGNMTNTLAGTVSTVDDPKGNSVTCNVAGMFKLRTTDYISVHVHSASDTAWGVAATTSFTAAYHNQSAGSASIGYVATDQAKVNAGWTEIAGYASSIPSGAFAPSSGRLTAAYRGIYLVSTQISIKQASGKHMAVRIVVDGNTTSQTPYAIRNSPSGSGTVTLFTSGLIFLKKNQQISVYVDSDTDTSWTIAAGSSFSAMMLQPVSDAPAAVGHVPVRVIYRTTNWVEIKKFATFTKLGTFASDNRFASNGRFYAPVDGLYYAAANVRLDYATSSYTRAIIAINGKVNTSNGLHSRRGYPPRYYYTVNIAGTVSLSAGDYLSIYIDTLGDTSWYVQTETSFSVHFISAKLSGIGFLADKLTDENFQGIGAKGWTEISGWHTTGKGLYSSAGGFPNSTGRYTVPYTGVYIVTANVELSGAASGTFQVSAVADNKPTVANGMISVRQLTPNNYFTHNLAGVAYLRKDQVLSVYVHSSVDTSWKMSETSGFSAVYHSSYLFVPGFSAVLGADLKVTATGYKEISNWATPTPGFGLFQSTTNFDAFTGRFTAPYAGAYFIAANVRLESAGLSSFRYFRLLLAINGQLSTTTSVTLSSI